MTAHRASGRSYTPLEWAGWLYTAKQVLSPDRHGDVRLLEMFMGAPGRVFEHGDILARLGATTARPVHSLSATHVGRLRRALCDLGFPDAIVNRPRVGYLLRADDAARILAFIEGFANRSPEALAAE